MSICYKVEEDLFWIRSFLLVVLLVEIIGLYSCLDNALNEKKSNEKWITTEIKNCVDD